MNHHTVTIRLRMPVREDGAAVWKLIRDAGTLDLNSAYCYLLLSDHFRSTCLVAEDDKGICGFISAFRCPDRPDTLFVWQIAVAPSRRRRGLGRKLLKTLLSGAACREIRYVEATVGPSNLASRGLFLRTAHEYGTECRLSAGYPASMFPADKAHEEELLIRFGPLPKQSEREHDEKRDLIQTTRGSSH
ncbi:MULTISPECIES: diaminobutyrate acetyltransferase [Paenibacillus]|uniref:diaminobutyrate acetyltransferase n=1 Tax=Paenibacillus TaxID=44249 RepID=UPI0022B8D271|nr:diaminobutyrate acetyltransferase [Paenibacillus caseinilyticus]MCZ8521874.1 diaminobutyrate acetyltransferase [Paenibacillus caseinilyticus]